MRPGLALLLLALSVARPVAADNGAAILEANAPEQMGKPYLVLDEIVSLDGARSVEGGAYVFVHFEQADPERATELRDAINTRWNCGRALLPSEAPAAWRVTDSPRHPDLLVMADPGCAVLSTEGKQGKITPGDHGWPPEMPEMKGIFYAMGPRIPAGARSGVLNVTDVYPLMMSILELPYPHSIQGDPGLPGSLLSPAP